MKTRSHCSGFTLVELLVVISIIGILIAILLPALNAALRQADRAKARGEVKDIVNAVKAYHSEYGRMPCEPSGVTAPGRPDVTFSGDSSFNPAPADAQARVINILRAIDTQNNPKRMVFLSVEATNSIVNGFFVDPWGQPYTITLNTDLDNDCVLPAGAPTNVVIGASACAWTTSKVARIVSW